MQATIGAFYGDFFGWVNLVGVLLQVFIVSRLFKYVGVRGALFVLPLIALGSYSLMALLPVLGIVRIAKVLENSTDYSIQNTARHALFLPTSREAKYKAKAAIDTFFWRVGDMLQAGFVLAGTWLAFTTRQYAWVNMALVSVWLILILGIYREHRRVSGCECKPDRAQPSSTGEVMKETPNPQPDRLCIPRISDTATGFSCLPNDMIERAVTRLGWLGLIYAATLNLVHWTRIYALPANMVAAWAMPSLSYFSLIAGTVLGLAICALAWSRRIPAQMMLDIGLIFEVVAAFCIAAMENSNPLIGEGWVRGVSGLALWIVFFVLVVPTSTGKTVLAALASAAMGPLGLLMYTGIYGSQLPQAGIWVSLFMPDVVCAVWAVVLSRFIYTIGRDLGQARRMGYYEADRAARTRRYGRSMAGEASNAGRPGGDQTDFARSRFDDNDD